VVEHIFLCETRLAKTDESCATLSTAFSCNRDRQLLHMRCAMVKC